MVAPAAAAAARTAATGGTRAAGTRAAGSQAGTRSAAADVAGLVRDTAGRSGANRSRSAGGNLRPTLTPPRRLGRRDLAGFGAGVLVYVLALNYLRHGKEGVTGWLRAKFLNDPQTELRAPRDPSGGGGSGSDGYGGAIDAATTEQVGEGQEIFVAADGSIDFRPIAAKI